MKKLISNNNTVKNQEETMIRLLQKFIVMQDKKVSITGHKRDTAKKVRAYIKPSLVRCMRRRGLPLNIRSWWVSSTGTQRKTSAILSFCIRHQASLDSCAHLMRVRSHG